MSAWGNRDRANNSPLYATLQVNKSPTTANQTGLYANTTVGKFITNEAVGLFGVDPVETKNKSNTANAVSHSGWNLRTVGSGPITSITLNNAPAGYSYSNAYISFTGANTTAANAQVVVNGSGDVVNVILNSGGAGFTSTPIAVANGSANNANLTFTLTMGGRANRIQTETLAVISTFSSNVINGGLY